MNDWIFGKTGKARFYKQDKYIYSASDNRCLFWEENGWWFAMKEGAPCYYVSDNWLFSKDGKPEFYFGQKSTGL